MSGKTEFAGFEYLAPGDSFSDDGYYFQSRNPVLADRLARLGARDHRHDEHAALLDPSDAPTVTVSVGDGGLPASTVIYVTYTLHDSDGGETLPVDATGEPTPGGFTAPAAAPDATVDYIAGTLLAGSIAYALTVADGAGGETTIGPSSLAVIVPGHANAEVVLSGLAAILADASGGAPGALWRLWRSMGGNWYLIATGTGDTFTDNGVAGDCSIEPPSVGTTVGANALHVTVPGGQPDGTVAYSIYASYDGTFTNPCLLGTYDIATAGVVHDYTALNALPGAPPARSTCYAGAHKIDQETETIGPWRGVEATTADLPSAGNVDGDVRGTLDDHALHIWNAGTDSWDTFGGGGGGGGTTVGSNLQTADYTLVLADAGLAVEMDMAGAGTLTIPPHSDVAFDLDTVLELCQVGAGAITVAAGAGVTLDSLGGLVDTAGQWAVVGLRQRAIDEWVLSGGLA